MNVETARMFHQALDAGATGFTHQVEVRDALCAVITMHQPQPVPHLDRSECRHCAGLALGFAPYPCRTVTAIGAAMRIRISTPDLTVGPPDGRGDGR